MKLIQLIQEIGDSTTKPYKWRKSRENEYGSKYVFDTDSGLSYQVYTENDNYTYGDRAILVNFSENRDQIDRSRKDPYLTNRGEVYRIMSTVAEITKDAIKAQNRGGWLLNKKPKIKYVVFSPMVRQGKEKYEDPLNNARTQQYLQYVKKEFPNSTVEDRNGMVVVTIDKGNNIKEENTTTKVTYTKPNFDTEWEEANRYPEFRKVGKEEWTRIASKGKTTNYSTIKDKLGNVDLDFDNLEKDKVERFNQAYERGRIETPIAVRFKDGTYDLLAGNTRLSGLVNAGLDPKVWIVDAPK